MRVTAVIPCHNEEASIGEVARKARRHVDRVLVVDNLSTDRTLEEAERVVEGWNLQRCWTRGAGITTGTGLAFALNPLPHVFADVVVTLDGDGQHDPDEIPLLLAPIERDEADVVVGSRFLGEYRVPRYRKFGIDVITWLYNVGDGYQLTDGLSCFRAFSRHAIKALMPVDESGFGFCPEMLVKARARGLRIAEVPVSCIYLEKFSMNSSMNPVSMGLGLALATVKWRVREELRR